MIVHNKLVRYRIADIINVSSKITRTHIFSEEEYINEFDKNLMKNNGNYRG